MSAASALQVVKQIQSIAEQPPTPELRACLNQVVSSLLFLLDHPDSRVRTNAARAMRSLCTGYAAEIRSLDLAKARAVLARCRLAATEGSTMEGEEELQRILEDVLGEEVTSKDTVDNTDIVQPSHGPPNENRGEVVLQVGEHADRKIRTAILESVVHVAGVVSVTLEGSYVIVSVRTPGIAADASFLADLLTAVKSHGGGTVSLIRTTAAGTRDSGSSGGGEGAPAVSAETADPQTVQREEGDEGAATGDGDGAEVDDSMEEPIYMDDYDEDFGSSSSAAPMPQSVFNVERGHFGQDLTQWSFFSQTNWMTGRRMQEFGDDPTIAARLAKAKKREEERKQEQQSQTGRLLSWFRGGST